MVEVVEGVGRGSSGRSAELSPEVGQTADEFVGVDSAVLLVRVRRLVVREHGQHLHQILETLLVDVLVESRVEGP